jgi:molybdate transport system ATP-binding protein
LADARRVQVKPEARHIGYVPQDGALFPHLNVRQNLRYGERAGAAVRDGMSFEQVCAVLDIAGLVDRAIAGLSGGERQRVALARAVLAKPKLLILDEPLVSLDAARKAAVLPYLQRIRSRLGLPLLYVSHAADEMVALCDDVLVLEEGRAIAQGAPSALFEQTEEPHFRLRK